MREQEMLPENIKHADFEVFAPSVPSRFQNVLCLQGSLPHCTQFSARVPCISGSSLTLHPPAPFPYQTSISSQRLFILTDGGSSCVTLFCLPLSGKEKAGTRPGPSLLCPQHPEEGLDPNRHSTSISLTAVKGISHITQLLHSMTPRGLRCLPEKSQPPRETTDFLRNKPSLPVSALQSVQTGFISTCWSHRCPTLFWTWIHSTNTWRRVYIWPVDKANTNSSYSKLWTLKPRVVLILDIHTVWNQQIPYRSEP